MTAVGRSISSAPTKANQAMPLKLDKARCGSPARQWQQCADNSGIPRLESSIAQFLVR
jgi:hypothetical protein